MEPAPRRTSVEPEQLLTFLDSGPKGHRALLATLAATATPTVQKFKTAAGRRERVGEACALDWRDLTLDRSLLTDPGLRPRRSPQSEADEGAPRRRRRGD
jgi:integrase